MLLVAELDLRDLELALALDVGLLGAVDHDVADRRVGEQLFERPEAEKLVDQNLLERELLAPVERDLQLCEHFGNDRPEFLGEFVLVERRGGFGIDTFEQARKHLLLDPVDRGFETFGTAVGRFTARVLTGGETVHRAHWGAGGVQRRRVGRRRQFVDRRELLAAAKGGRSRRARTGRAFHGLGHAKARPAPAADSPTFAECAHSTPPTLGFSPKSGGE